MLTTFCFPPEVSSHSSATFHPPSSPLSAGGECPASSVSLSARGAVRPPSCSVQRGETRFPTSEPIVVDDISQRFYYINLFKCLLRQIQCCTCKYFIISMGH